MLPETIALSWTDKDKIEEKRGERGEDKREKREREREYKREEESCKCGDFVDHFEKYSVEIQ